MSFKPRLTIPQAGNPYYNTKDAGGYSQAVKGNPTYPGLNVLHNCVGYAYGRFNEIVGERCMKYLAPVNAELFIDYMNYRTKGVTSGDRPKLGAVAVWQKGATKKGTDGAGHVAIVEQINEDGSIITSESGYKSSKPFWTTRRTNSNGRWGMSSSYKFLGFIYNPAVTETIISPNPTNLSSSSAQLNVGDILFFAGYTEYVSSTDSKCVETAPSIVKVTKTAKGKKHAYHCRSCSQDGTLKSGVYGWVNAEDLYSVTEYKVACEVILGRYGNGSIRKTMLTKAGFNYENVQKIVNAINK